MANTEKRGGFGGKIAAILAAAGSAIKSATCVVTVKKPVAPIEIGDFYYSDGTWSTELNRNKTVIGIVFSKLNAVSSDNNLLEDYPNCSNGLVVALPEYSSVLGQFGYSSVYDWFISNGYPAFATLPQRVSLISSLSI